MKHNIRITLVCQKTWGPISILILLVSTVNVSQVYAVQLPIPPILDYTIENSTKEFELSAQKNTHDFSLIKLRNVNTYSYGKMDYLGPTIRIKKGDEISIRIHNKLPVETSFHQHGLHLPSDADGVMKMIPPNSTWTSSYSVIQQAGTYWYHPHKFGSSGYQVAQGLTGILLIDDEIQGALPIPHTYGVDDIPLIIQDIAIKNKNIIHTNDGHHSLMMGNVGNTLVTNGKVSPTFTATRSLIRVRLLNASSFTPHIYQFADNRTFSLIANDAGLLESPIPVRSLLLSPGERREIIVDIKDISAKHTLALQANVFNRYTTNALIIKGSQYPDSTTRIPDILVEVPSLSVDAHTIHREFALETTSEVGGTSINNKYFDSNRIDERIFLDTTEVWTITNPIVRGGMMMSHDVIHSFHPHNTSFQVISVDGNPPNASLRGWKDTLYVPPGSTIQIAVNFDSRTGTGIYPYHCHLLEHEDFGMMGMFELISN